ncbi:MAG TPA: cytochrome c [Bryobacteraceae bacterium]|nr:cytochrome c [Bryobacteraceae bacterium]
MKRRAIFVLLVSLSAAGMLMAQKIKLVPPARTSGANGKQMFMNYCASCHGEDAKGNGPAASALKTAPTDLTLLAAHHNGVFPAEHVSRYISGADVVPAHGTRDMPVWGDVFKTMQSSGDTAMVDIRVNVLTEYLKSVQSR